MKLALQSKENSFMETKQSHSGEAGSLKRAGEVLAELAVNWLGAKLLADGWLLTCTWVGGV